MHLADYSLTYSNMQTTHSHTVIPLSIRDQQKATFLLGICRLLCGSEQTDTVKVSKHTCNTVYTPLTPVGGEPKVLQLEYCKKYMYNQISHTLLVFNVYV